MRWMWYLWVEESMRRKGSEKYLVTRAESPWGPRGQPPDLASWCWCGVLSEGLGHCHAAWSSDSLCSEAGTSSPASLTLVGGGRGWRNVILASCQMRERWDYIGESFRPQPPAHLTLSQGSLLRLQADSETLEHPSSTAWHSPGPGKLRADGKHLVWEGGKRALGLWKISMRTTFIKRGKLDLNGWKDPTSGKWIFSEYSCAPAWKWCV